MNFILILWDFLNRFQSPAFISRDEKSAIERGKIAIYGFHISVKKFEMFLCSVAFCLRLILVWFGCFTGVIGECDVTSQALRFVHCGLAHE